MRGASILVLTVWTLAGPAGAASTRCWIDQGAVVAAAAFGDIAGDFVIDVGAPVSQLHVTRANSDGIDDINAVRPLVFAGQRLSAVRMVVADLDSVPPADTNIAGVIGADVLARHPIAIQFAPCRITWGPAKRTARGVELPVVMVGGAPTVQAQVSDGHTAREAAMVISTGRPETLTADAVLSRPLTAGAYTHVRLRAVEVGGRLLEQVPGGVADAGAGSLGTGVWRHWQSMRLNLRRRLLELR